MKALSIVCYVIAGFCVYALMLVSFFNEIPLPEKLMVMSIFGAFAVVCLFGGLHASGCSRWQRDIGVVLLTSSVMMVFIVISIVCMLATPEFAQQFPDHKLGFFSDYVTGSLCVLTFLGLGWLLISQDQTKRKRDNTFSGNATKDRRAAESEMTSRSPSET